MLLDLSPLERNTEAEAPIIQCASVPSVCQLSALHSRGESGVPVSAQDLPSRSIRIHFLHE